MTFFTLNEKKNWWNFFQNRFIKYGVSDEAGYLKTYLLFRFNSRLDAVFFKCNLFSYLVASNPTYTMTLVNNI